MLKAKISRKPLITILSIILCVIFIFIAFRGIYYLFADALIYHYVNVNAEADYSTPYDVGTIGRGIKYPFFGNPLTVSEETGTGVGLPFGAGEKNIFVYHAINEPICLWIDYMRYRYRNNAAVDYTVEMDKEYITVSFSGMLTENGKAIPIEQKFAFSIADASPENLPVWLNEEEISEGFNEYLTYLDGDTEAPEWIENDWLKKPSV